MNRISKKPDTQTAEQTVVKASPLRHDEKTANTTSGFSKLRFLYRANCPGENDSNWHVP